ncbi:MAG TPA: N-acetylglucosamine-6-phosphate deacetylase [Bryobacteraceae bacterium]|nr:N-acetylglucosamine-6-phosphate deacetylase [Bryobacteraceae bacterium]
MKVFRNANIITDSGVIADGMVVVHGDRIDYAGPRREIPPAAEIVDVAGQFLAPGFVDIHIHGGAGSDFMDATDADIETVFRYHAAHGTTSLCPTTATAPLAEILSALEALERYRNGPQRFGRALGAHIEGPYLAMTKRGCHLPQFVRNPEEREWRQILERGPIASVTLAPELPGARMLVEELHHRGANANAGHSEALYQEVEDAADWGVRHVTHLYCAMTDAMNNRWRGTPNPRSGGIVEAVYLDDRLSSELITDGKHLSREMLRLALRHKGYEKLAIVTDAMRGAGMPDGEYTFGPRHGLIAVVKNGEARIPDGTALASSVCPMNQMVRVFRDLTRCPLWQAVRMASLTPAEIVHRAADIGSITPGKLADLIIIDDQLKVDATYVGGTLAAKS